jgi:hypothetical protein
MPRRRQSRSRVGPRLVRLAEPVGQRDEFLASMARLSTGGVRVLFSDIEVPQR